MDPLIMNVSLPEMGTVPLSAIKSGLETRVNGGGNHVHFSFDHVVETSDLLSERIKCSCVLIGARTDDERKLVEGQALNILRSVIGGDDKASIICKAV